MPHTQTASLSAVSVLQEASPRRQGGRARHAPPVFCIRVVPISLSLYLVHGRVSLSWLRRSSIGRLFVKTKKQHKYSSTLSENKFDSPNPHIHHHHRDVFIHNRSDVQCNMLQVSGRYLLPLGLSYNQKPRFRVLSQDLSDCILVNCPMMCCC